jgi:hypothetical protein
VSASEPETKMYEEVFEKYYVKVALKNNSAIVSLIEIYNEAYKDGKDDVISEFVSSDKYSEWQVFLFEDNGDLVAVPSLTKKLKEMGLEKVIAWMYFNEVPQEKIEKFVTDVTLECLVENGFIEDILKLAKKHFSVEEDWSGYNKHNYSGKIVYSIYDNGELLGKITENIWYCNRCVCDYIFHDGPGCYENWIEKCVSWRFGEPKDEEL